MLKVVCYNLSEECLQKLSLMQALNCSRSEAVRKCVEQYAANSHRKLFPQPPPGIACATLGMMPHHVTLIQQMKEELGLKSRSDVVRQAILNYTLPTFVPTTEEEPEEEVEVPVVVPSDCIVLRNDQGIRVVRMGGSRC